MCLKKELFHICISEKGPFRQIFEFHIDCAVTVVDGHHRIGLAPSLLAGFCPD